MNVAALIAGHARATPDAAALLLGDGRVMTYGEFERRSAGLAAALRQRGIGVGSVVLVLQPVSPALYQLLAALFRLGAIAAVPDASALRRSVTAAARRLRPQGVAGPAAAHLLRLLVPGLLGVPAACVTHGWVPGGFSLEVAARSGGTADIATLPAEHPALITFTSGTTGAAKAIIRSHRLLLAQQAALAPVLGLAPGLRVLSTLPMFVLSLLAAGATAVLPAVDVRRPAEIDAGRLLRQIADSGISRVVASPAACDRLAGASGAADLLGGVQALFTGGGPVFPDLLDRLAGVMPAARLVAVYGSSEAEPIAQAARDDLDSAARAASAAGGGLLAGCPVSAAKVAILADHVGQPLGPWTEADFAAACVPQGMAGEIVVTGEHVVGGYLDGVGDGDSKIRVGDSLWHRTGDAGRFDDQGRLWLLGRCSARVDATYPLAVEATARAILGGRRCACVGVDGRPCLVVEAMTAEEERRLAAVWPTAPMPDLFSVPDIPLDRRHQSKVDYRRLSSLVSGPGFADRRPPGTPDKTTCR